jgi:serine/threonine protein kinase
MELLSESLESLFNRCQRKFSVKTIAMIGIQLLHRLEHIHQAKLLHRDCKPDNLVMGLGEQQHVVYLIDLGLCRPFVDEAGAHVPLRKNKKLIGTPRYASVNTHMGLEQSRRDDLEAAAYILLYFSSGQLPWQGLHGATKQNKYEAICAVKRTLTPAQLCRGLPPEFEQLLVYARGLRFDQEPDYRMLRGLFYALYRREGFADDCVYDWMLPATERHCPAGARTDRRERYRAFRTQQEAQLRDLFAQQQPQPPAALHRPLAPLPAIDAVHDPAEAPQPLPLPQPQARRRSSASRERERDRARERPPAPASAPAEPPAPYAEQRQQQQQQQAQAHPAHPPLASPASPAAPAAEEPGWSAWEREWEQPPDANANANTNADAPAGPLPPLYVPALGPRLMAPLRFTGVAAERYTALHACAMDVLTAVPAYLTATLHSQPDQPPAAADPAPMLRALLQLTDTLSAAASLPREAQASYQALKQAYVAGVRSQRSLATAGYPVPAQHLAVAPEAKQAFSAVRERLNALSAAVDQPQHQAADPPLPPPSQQQAAPAYRPVAAPNMPLPPPPADGARRREQEMEGDAKRARLEQGPADALVHLGRADGEASTAMSIPAGIARVEAESKDTT